MKIVLIVDDEVELGRMLGDVVEAAGYRVVVRKSGEEAILLTKTAGALITDFHMRRMDGAELIEAAKLENPDIKALLMTATPQDVPKDHLASKVLTKPFRVDDVLKWLREVLPG